MQITISEKLFCFVLDSYKPCPRLEMGDGDVVVFKGTCQLKISTGKLTENNYNSSV